MTPVRILEKLVSKEESEEVWTGLELTQRELEWLCRCVGLMRRGLSMTNLLPMNSCADS